MLIVPPPTTTNMPLPNTMRAYLLGEANVTKLPPTEVTGGNPLVEYKAGA